MRAITQLEEKGLVKQTKAGAGGGSWISLVSSKSTQDHGGPAVAAAPIGAAIAQTAQTS